MLEESALRHHWKRVLTKRRKHRFFMICHSFKIKSSAILFASMENYPCVLLVLWFEYWNLQDVEPCCNESYLETRFVTMYSDSLWWTLFHSNESLPELRVASHFFLSILYNQPLFFCYLIYDLNLQSLLRSYMMFQLIIVCYVTCIFT